MSVVLLEGGGEWIYDNLIHTRSKDPNSDNDRLLIESIDSI